MPNYLLSYHGGGMPETEEEQGKVMAAWGDWMGKLGDKLVDGGLPVVASKTIASDGTVTDGGGANPVSGYSVIRAANMDEAVALARDCPVFLGGASLEVGETMDMG